MDGRIKRLLGFLRWCFFETILPCRQPAVFGRLLCSNFYFYPLDMIPIVSPQPWQLNGLVKPPWRTALCSRLSGGGSCLSLSPTLALFSLSFPLHWLIFPSWRFDLQARSQRPGRLSHRCTIAVPAPWLDVILCFRFRRHPAALRLRARCRYFSPRYGWSLFALCDM